MSCNCTTTNPELPTVAQDQAIISGGTTCVPCNSDPSCSGSTSTEGSTLASTWLDAKCCNEGLTLLGRIGDKLARFGGTGFISLVNGVASVVSSVPLKVSTLWHRRWKPTPTAAPILGDPLAYPYQVVADAAGDLHAIKGPAEEDAVPFWSQDAGEFTQKPESELPKRQKGLLPRESELELVGYTAIPAEGETDAVRPMSTLAGAGLVYLEQQDTVDSTCNCPGCDPEESKASVAKLLALPVPVAAEVFTLKYSTALGLHWSQDA